MNVHVLERVWQEYGGGHGTEFILSVKAVEQWPGSNRSGGLDRGRKNIAGGLKRDMKPQGSIAMSGPNIKMSSHVESSGVHFEGQYGWRQDFFGSKSRAWLSACTIGGIGLRNTCS